MEVTERTLREILDLLDGVSVQGRENRRKMSQAEQKLIILTNAATEVNKRRAEKEAQQHDEAGNEQGNV